MVDLSYLKLRSGGPLNRLLTRLPETDHPVVGRHFASPGYPHPHNVGNMFVTVIRSGLNSAIRSRNFEAKRLIFKHYIAARPRIIYTIYMV